MRADGVAEPRAQLLDQLGLVVVAQLERGPARAARSARSRVLPFSQTSRWPAGSLRVSRKIVSGAGIELKARNASSASRSISPRGRARSSEANSRPPPATAVVERLDPVAVSGEDEPPLAASPRARPRTSRAAAARSRARAARRGGRAPRCRRACGSGGPRARARRAARGSCRARRSGRRGSCRPRSRSAGRRSRGR